MAQEVRPDTCAGASSQRILNAPKGGSSLSIVGSQLDSDPARLVRQKGQPGSPEEEEWVAKGCGKNCPDRVDAGGLNFGSSQRIDYRRTQ